MSDADLARVDDEDDDDAGAIEEAFLTYWDAGLRLPPVPRELAPLLREHGDWYFGTSDANPSDRAGFLAAARSAGSEAEVGFGHFGHGIASWYLCYRLILEPLAVFMRQSFGNVSDEEEAAANDARRVNAITSLFEELVVLADAARAGGALPAGRRLIVVIDDREGDFWQVGPDGEPQPGDNVLADARTFLSPAT
jgi:hypothetical protein